MTKKDFISLADAIRAPLLGKNTIQPHEQEAIIAALCYWMKSDNPAFMENRWRSYLAGLCGKNGGKIK